MGERVVLVAVDGSSQAEKAFNWYCGHIWKENDKCLVVYGAEYNVSVGLLSGNADMDKISQKFKEENDRVGQLTAKYAGLMREKQIKGESVPLTGQKPGEAIVAKALEVGASMIVMGTRGMGPVRRTIMGSVSDYVVHHASCPIVVVRDE